MSKLTQIEAALKQMDQAGFQRLGDTYLRRKGYEYLYPIGLSLGSEKTTTGTPDTLVLRPDGKYVFVEYTTQQSGVASKFAEDLEKCLDEKKTGIPPGRIAEIILCHNGKLSPAEEHTLGETCRAHGVVLTTIGLGLLAHELYENYQGLARDFLGIEVDTGQILPPKDFISAYSRGSLATPLDTTFRFRDEETNRVLGELEDTNVVLVAGRAGVGKSRLALECAQRYAASHPEIQVWCIFNRGADLFQDLRSHFGESGAYLLVVDDANRLTRFEYTLDLLRNAREGRTFKILATVRDYALDLVMDAARQFGAREPIEVGGMSNEQIQTLARDEFGITHHAYLERIAEIAHGNPRLAMMAARVARDANTLESIADVSNLYDEYFRTIRQDISDLQDPTLLQVSAIVAFFRHVDRSNAELVGAITDSLGLDPNVFWRAVRRLHDLEVFDLYADEVVRVSDQVLATYLFYLAAFKEGVLDLGTLFTEFFPRFRHRFVDALNSVTIAFGGDEVASKLRLHVTGAREVFEQRGDEDGVLHLLDVFGVLIPTEALVTANDMITKIEPEAALEAGAIFTESTDSVPSPSPLSILSHFHHNEDAERLIAVNLIVDYLERRPDEAPLIVRLLKEGYGVRHTSYLEGYVVERQTAEVLAKRADVGRKYLPARLLLAYARAQLQTRFHRLEPKGGLSFTSYNFHVPATGELLDLRRFLWGEVFTLFQVPELREHVLELLESHITSGLDAESRNVIAEDAPVILQFFMSSLDKSSYRHGTLVRDYLAVLERLEVPFDVQLSKQFTSDALDLSELLFTDRHERSQLGWRDYERQRRERIAAYAVGLNSAGLLNFLRRVAEIRSALADGHHKFQFDTGVTQVLLAVAERVPTAFAEVLIEHLYGGNALALQPYSLVSALINACGPDGAYERLTAGDIPQRSVWLLGYFMALPPEAVTTQLLDALVHLYEEAPPVELVRDLSYLMKFTQADPNVVLRVTRILLSRVEVDPVVGHVLADLFNSFGEFSQGIGRLFSEEPQLLTRAYFAACRVDPYVDHDGRVFDDLVTMDPGFVREWMVQIHENIEWPTRRNDSRDYAFLWRRADADDVIRRIIAAEREASTRRFIRDPYLLVFFMIVEGTEDAESLRARQDSILDVLITEHCADQDLIALLFDVISNFGPERRRGRIATFLACNQDFDAFCALQLEPSHGGWRGSAVPWYQARVEFFESLLPLFNTPALLRHRQDVARQIERLRESLEKEKKHDFMRD